MVTLSLRRTKKTIMVLMEKVLMGIMAQPMMMICRSKTTKTLMMMALLEATMIMMKIMLKTTKTTKTTKTKTSNFTEMASHQRHQFPTWKWGLSSIQVTAELESEDSRKVHPTPDKPTAMQMQLVQAYGRTQSSVLILLPSLGLIKATTRSMMLHQTILVGRDHQRWDTLVHLSGAPKENLFLMVFISRCLVIAGSSHQQPL